MKYLIVLLFLSCLITSYSSAQIIEDEPVVNERVRIVSTIAVTFIPNDTCNLFINGKDFGEIAKNRPRTIRLPLGNHRLFFESLETGESIKKRSFRLTRDSLAGGRYIYPVTFKQQN